MPLVDISPWKNQTLSFNITGILIFDHLTKKKILTKGIFGVFLVLGGLFDFLILVVLPSYILFSSRSFIVMIINLTILLIQIMTILLIVARWKWRLNQLCDRQSYPQLWSDYVVKEVKNINFVIHFTFQRPATIKACCCLYTLLFPLFFSSSSTRVPSICSREGDIQSSTNFPQHYIVADVMQVGTTCSKRMRRIFSIREDF